MPTLTATKALTYATRRLRAGDEFVAKPRHARVLVAIGKARASGGAIEPPKKPAKKAKPKAAPRKRSPLDHDLNDKPGGSTTREAMSKLRATYREVVGRAPSPRWGAAELQKRIDEASAS